MQEINYLAVVVAAVVVFVFAAVYYSVMAGAGKELGAAWAQGQRPDVRLIAVELAKSLVIALVVAVLVARIGIADAAGAIVLGLALWVAFPLMLLLGSVTRENVPWQLAAIHAGDWIVKLVVISVIAAIWR